MSDGWNIALLGATGAVGTALLDIMQERQFPFGKLFLLSSERSAGETMRVNGQSLQVSEAAQFDWSQAQLAFFVTGAQASALYAADATAAGCLVVDVSGLFALEPDVPLVVPGVNDDMLADYRNRNLVAVADALTSQLLLAIKPLTDLAGLSYLHVSTMLSASTHGKAAVDDLAGQSARLLNGLAAEPGFFPRQLAFNIGTAHIAGYTLEGKARGTTQVFDAYSAFVGSDARASLAALLPPPAVERIRLRGAIDEEALRLLAHLVYDVRRDDMQLRRVAGLPGEFDRLRKHYYQRREWSSLCVETDDDAGADTLRQLGFQARPAVG